MILYRLHKKRIGNECDGFEFFLIHREARKRQKEVQDGLMNEEGAEDEYGEEYHSLDEIANDVKIDRIEFPATKSGILNLLNMYADHPDNG